MSAFFIVPETYAGCIRYIGGWPSSDERLPNPDCAVLDCIQELPRHVTTKHYLTTPVWDTHGQPCLVNTISLILVLRWLIAPVEQACVCLLPP